MFTEKELGYMQDTDFLLTKAIVSEKVSTLLNHTHEQLKQYLRTQDVRFPEGVKARAGKISRGENYQGLPYILLDYPRKFTQDDVFALRTMYWWGNFFSITFQLGGESWHRYQPTVIRHAEDLHQLSASLCISDDPWQHHRDPHYYRSLQNLEISTIRKILEQQNFLKLATFLSIDEWSSLPDQAQLFFQKMIRLIEL